LVLRHWSFVIGPSSLVLRHWSFVIGPSSLEKREIDASFFTNHQLTLRTGSPVIAPKGRGLRQGVFDEAPRSSGDSPSRGVFGGYRTRCQSCCV